MFHAAPIYYIFMTQFQTMAILVVSSWWALNHKLLFTQLEKHCFTGCCNKTWSRHNTCHEVSCHDKRCVQVSNCSVWTAARRNTSSWVSDPVSLLLRLSAETAEFPVISRSYQCHIRLRLCTDYWCYKSVNSISTLHSTADFKRRLWSALQNQEVINKCASEVLRQKTFT